MVKAHVRTALWWLIGALVLFVGGMIALRSTDAFTMGSSSGYLKAVGRIGREPWFQTGFFLHVITASPVLLIGWLQLSPRLRTAAPRWHRNLGKAYVLLVLVAAAPGGLVLAFGAAGGLAGKLCFWSMSLLWFLFTLRAWLRVRKGDYAGHEADMLRSYALAFGAVALRLWMFVIGGLLGWRTPEAYAFCAWMSWVPNLLAAELWMRWKGNSFRIIA